MGLGFDYRSCGNAVLTYARTAFIVQIAEAWETFLATGTGVHVALTALREHALTHDTCTDCFIACFWPFRHDNHKQNVDSCHADQPAKAHLEAETNPIQFTVFRLSIHPLNVFLLQMPAQVFASIRVTIFGKRQEGNLITRGHSSATYAANCSKLIFPHAWDSVYVLEIPRNVYWIFPRSYQTRAITLSAVIYVSLNTHYFSFLLLARTRERWSSTTTIVYV